MSHRSGGAYRILERPVVYESFQKLLGARAARRRFVRDFIRPFSGARLLDIGCGPGSLLDDLTAGVHYTGFDMNHTYIDAARKRYGDRGRFFQARVGEDIGAITDEGYDFVIAKSILHHLIDDDAHQLLEAACRALKPGGVFVSIDIMFYDRQRWMSRLLTSLDRGGRVRTAPEYRQLAEAHFSDLETWSLTDLLLLPYGHYIIRATTARDSGAAAIC